MFDRCFCVNRFPLNSFQLFFDCFSVLLPIIVQLLFNYFSIDFQLIFNYLSINFQLIFD